MADEGQYSSGSAEMGTPASLKRKYEDSGSHRPTGFSAPIISTSPDSGRGPPPSYNAVPNAADEIQLAKQRAQEIASRLYNSSGAGTVPGAGNLDAKRTKVENGSSGFDSYDKGFSSAPSGDLKPQYTSQPGYGYHGGSGTSKKIDIPNDRVGVIIGKSGETIKYLQTQSGARIQVTRDMDADPNSPTRMVELMGTPDQIAHAERLIKDVLNEAESGGPGVASRRLTGQSGSEHFSMRIPNNKVGLVIGKGGETIKNMQQRSGARIQVVPLHLPPGDISTERTVQMDGTSEQIEIAKQLVNDVISGENRLRNQSMTGMYGQQGYQSRPPSNWGTGAPVQQAGYGYGQPGGYSAPPPQYNMSQPPYSGYPTGYASNWDQSTVPPSQQTPQAAGYDYYSQQPMSQQQQNAGGPAAPADGSGYNYPQPPASGYNQQPGSGYSQDSYGNYHAPPQSGYAQPPPYDQHQQGYGTPGYGNVTNPTQDGHASNYGSQGDAAQAPASVGQQPTSVGQQGYNASQQPSPNPTNYQSQGTNQPGYGVPPTSQAAYGTQSQVQSGYGPGYGPPQPQKPGTNPPVYGQSTQSPSTPGGYGQSAPLQQGYPYSQPPASGYGQTDSGSNKAPPSGYGAPAQPGYVAPPYGAPPVSQPSYGQPPPSYSSPYAGGYTQPSAYPTDGNTGGNTRGTYDTAPSSQSVQPGGVAKASPKS